MIKTQTELSLKWTEIYIFNKSNCSIPIPLVQALTSTLDTVEGALVSFLVIFMVILLPVSPLKLTSTVPSGDKTGV